ncbi:MAG: hypothetical protein V3T43_06285 [Nitrosomonadaceae bacterium]
MKIEFGNGSPEYGPGVRIELDGDELAHAITTYLHAHNVLTFGPRSVRVNGERCEQASVYVDPSGHVMAGGKRWTGRGEIEN